jgi:branched-chain amino acid transport system substrate-binding protein
MSACGTSTQESAGSTSAPINVLAIVDTTGPTKAFGSQELAGIQGAAEYYNNHGGVNGRDINVTVVSDNGDPATATSEYIKAMTTDSGKYAYVYAGSEGSEVTALIPVVVKYPVVGYVLDDGSGTCSTASKCPNVFSNLGPASIPETEAAAWIKKRGYTNVGVLEQEADFTQSETPAIGSALQQAGISETKLSFSTTAVDLTSQMSQLKGSGAQVVYAEALGASAGYVLKARAALNWNVPVVFDIAGSALDLTTLAPGVALTNVYQTLCPCAVPTVHTPALEAFKSTSQENALGAFPANLIGDGWDSIVLLADGVKQAGSTDHQALISALENLNSSAQADPLFFTTRHHSYSSANHENAGQTTNDFAIAPAGAVKGGQVQPQS